MNHIDVRAPARRWRGTAGRRALRARAVHGSVQRARRRAD